MMHFLVNARQTSHGWELPYPVETAGALGVAAVGLEVMHRELKSGRGLGDQQQWSARGAVTVTQWVVWVYAGPHPDGSRVSARHSAFPALVPPASLDPA
ncbi:MAG: hypothetical protein M9950_01280 [Thermomicrobiales bacterium]|nr:hypothetical protein [Thermomicrobiales bacterium]